MKAMKTIIPWLLVVALLAGAYYFYAANAKQEVELANLRTAAQETQTLRAENAELKKLQVQTDELDRLRKDNADLPRLRNEVRQLREQNLALAKQSQSAQTQVQSAQAQVQAALAQAKAARPTPPPGLTPEQQKLFEQRYGLAATNAASPAQALINACLNNLRQIDGAKQQWALENRKPASALVNQSELLNYFKDHTMPVCPAGGVYTLNTVGLPPLCNIPGHALPK